MLLRQAYERIGFLEQRVQALMAENLEYRRAMGAEVGVTVHNPPLSVSSPSQDPPPSVQPYPVAPCPKCGFTALRLRVPDGPYYYGCSSCGWYWMADSESEQ